MKIITVILFFAISINGHAQDQLNPFVKVFGEGKTSIVPDEIFVGFTIYAKDDAVSEARRKNKALAMKSIAYLSSLKIPQRHIQTQYMTVHPVKENNRSEIISHYRATQSITVCLSDIETFGKVVDELLAMGITQINNPIFRSTKKKEKMIEAQLLALANARKEAERMATALGMRIANPIEIIDIIPNQRNFNTNAYESIASGNNDAGSDGIALGELIFKSEVEVKFELVE